MVIKISSVLSLGILVADIIGKPIDRLPDTGTLGFLEALQFHIGGCAANTAVTLSKLGFDTDVVGLVGKDPLGSSLIEELDTKGVGTKHIQTSQDNTSATMVTVSEQGERSFSHFVGANGNLSPNHIPFNSLQEYDVIHIGGEFLLPGLEGSDLTKVVKEAKNAGKITTLDTAGKRSTMSLSPLKPALPYIDFLLPSIGEARAITGKEKPAEIAGVFLNRGVSTVGLKMGSEGCFIKNSETEIELSSLNVDVQDTTGAGDAFVAGFIAGLLLDYDLLDCSRLATTVAAFCVEQIGATSGIPALQTVLNRAASSFSNEKFSLDRKPYPNSS